jgi:ABC-2 type transport system ATP-binding protein
MIKVKNVTKKFAGKYAVNNITFNVRQGDILGFLGPNGAGKTTTMKMIVGSLSTTFGSIEIDKYNILDNPFEAKKLIGYLPENPPLYHDMTVKEYLTFAGRLKGLSRKELPGKLDFSIKACSIGDVRDKLIKNLSKGFKQRVGISAALIHTPPILILDEPTIGLDPKQIIEIRNLIKSLAHNHTVILSTHILSEVAMTCNKVIIIHQGEIVAEDSFENLERSLHENPRTHVKIKNPPDNNNFVISELKKIDGVLGVICESSENYIIEADKNKESRDKISQCIINNNWGLLELKQDKLSLEEVFIKLTLAEKKL